MHNTFDDIKHKNIPESEVMPIQSPSPRMNSTTFQMINLSMLASTDDSHDEGRLQSMIILTTMLSIFCVLGIVGNAIAFYIYMKKREKSTSTIFILSLAVTDFLTCLIVVPYTIAAELLQYHLVYDVVCKSYLFLITSNVPLSAFIMVAIGFDRYFCICHPFLHILTVKIAKICVFLLTVFSFALGIITSLQYGVYLESSRLIQTELPNDTEYYGEYYYIEPSNESQELPPLPKNFTYYGICVPNEIILSNSTSDIYQKIYAALFLFSFIIVAVLYALIYRSILVRRAWRNRCKRASCYTSVNCGELGMEETQLTAVAVNGIAPPLIGAAMGKGPIRAAAALREKMMYANIKTAAMLFVVTLIFIISYLPSWLMGLELIPFNLIIYQLYFLNNVANPFIYAFMNRTFRDDLKQLLKKC
ncbi:hypothetical protein LOTGIDRAFT_158646 [Lottia gigantea]|uniref:G-protein coupled receptors family 1 profile domain-containing protein n=1 Tax=Lottia gigantea TaxID=225164 RepID=V4CCD3_LOTGI|nr:hypothetical protein LOTGIDRAFT_158646 [Lottia gigantea]ESO99554.1 hypothetical protein LOTGIDRAFT_158646 [Lottia gigantea]